MYYQMRYYQKINGHPLSLEEKVLSIATQQIDRHTCCTTVSRIAKEVIKHEGGNPYSQFRQVQATISKLESEGWLVWERVARLNNIHLVDRNLQQHPMIAIRKYRETAQ